MNRDGLRQKAVPVVALLLALGASSLQAIPVHAYLGGDDGSTAVGEVTLDPIGPDGDVVKHPGGPGGPGPGDGGGGNGGNTDTQRADPDDLSFNNPRMNVPVVPVTPAHAAWFGFLRLWLERFAAQFFLMYR